MDVRGGERGGGGGVGLSLARYTPTVDMLCCAVLCLGCELC